MSASNTATTIRDFSAAKYPIAGLIIVPKRNFGRGKRFVL
jgi:hypothetical protein